MSEQYTIQWYRFRRNRYHCLFLFLLILPFFAVAADEAEEAVHTQRREAMVRDQIERRGVSDPRVLAAMRSVKRHLFVPPALVSIAYQDGPLPIGHGQTISQPYIVAYMTEALRLGPTDKVFEVGTGSGYQAAVLAEIVDQVYTVEILEALAESAKKRLAELGYDNVHVKYGDGYQGWPEFAPFDAIIVTAAPDHIPEKLIEQLKVGGRMILPVGTYYQELKLVTKTEGGFHEQRLIPVRFVPMVKGNDG